MVDTTHDGELLGLIAASDYRQSVVNRLADGAATPSTIAESTDIKIAHVSRALSTLRDAGAVELLVPEERKKGRVYGLTDAGEQVAERFSEVAGGV